MENKLSLVSLIAALLMSGVAVVLSLQNRADALERQEAIDQLRGHFVAQGEALEDATAQNEMLVETSRQQAVEAEMKEDEIARLKAELEVQSQHAQALDDQFSKIQEDKERALTPVQRKIVAAPVIARVDRYVPDLGFVALNAGANKNLSPGQEYHIRRDRYVIAKIQIGDTVEAQNSIANVDPGSIPEGFTILPGDEVIQYFP